MKIAQHQRSTRLLSLILTGILSHTPLAFAGCDLPMFAGARLFGAAASSGIEFMATGDFNHDGFLDVATTDSNKTLSVLLGNGDGTFQPAVNYAVPEPKNLAVADFNGDGKLDLAIWSSFSIVVMLGNGDGTFKAPIPASSQGGAPVVGDFNGDGKPDLAITGIPAYILLGKGDGTFQPPVSNGNVFFAGFGVAAGDLNGDGKLDVIAGSNDGIFVMLGDGKGNLSTPVDIGFGPNPTQVALADVNGDKKLDAVVLDSLGGNFWILLGNGDGTFQAATSYPMGTAQGLAPGMLLADLNGDGILDIAVAGQTPLPGVQFLNAPGTILVFSGNGDGTFQPAVQYNPSGQVNWALATGDFNGDGLPDLVFASNRQSTPTQVGMMFGKPDGTFLSPASYAVGPIPGLPALADLNGDGALDIVVANAGFNSNLSVLLGNGDGTFQPAVSYPTAFGATSVVVGDFNGDGKLDIAVGNGVASNILVFPGNGDGTFRAPVASFNVIGGATYLAAGDFNKDGKLDLAVMGAVGVQIALGNGDGTFHGSLSLGPPGAFGVIAPLAVADLNGDGNPDLVYSASNSTGTAVSLQPGNIWVMLGHGDGTFGAAVSYSIVKMATSVAIGDLNGDGKPDLAVADYAAGSADVAVLLGNGDGTFQTAVKYAAVNGADAVLMADFNGDGNLDLAVVSNSSGANSSGGPAGAVTVLLGLGDGTFRDSIVYGAGNNPLSLAVGDLNGDGQPDLVFSDDLANAAVVLMNSYVPGSSGSACTVVPPLGN